MQKYDIAVLGGGLGGLMAAVSAAKQGKNVLLTEETDWIGGQMTSQAVPPDEHRWIETTGCTATYRRFRDRVREFYQSHIPLAEGQKGNDKLNPGCSSVSLITHDPRISLHLLYEILLPWLCNHRITLMLNTKAVSAVRRGRKIESVSVRQSDTGETTEVAADYFIDATETGYLLPLTGTAYRKGAECKDDTGEPHGLPKADPDEMQPVTWVAAFDYVEGEDFTIEKPAEYNYYQNLDAPFSDCKVLSWYGPGFKPGDKRQFTMFEDGTGLFSLFRYRRIAFTEVFEKGFMPHDVTLLNWPQNDYFLDNIFESGNDERNEYMARQLTLSFVYWLQTEAPRPDGGKGFPGVRLRGDVTGTPDGLAKAPYIRESRRIVAEHTVLEQHISAECNQQPPTVPDSVGVGCYRIDLHLTTRQFRHFFQMAWPFEIPLGSLIPTDTDNLLPGCKNIGTTQLTNGCFREHPTEWNVGETVGYLAAFAMDQNVTPSAVRNTPGLLAAFQRQLSENGIQLHWDKELVTPI